MVRCKWFLSILLTGCSGDKAPAPPPAGGDTEPPVVDSGTTDTGPATIPWECYAEMALDDGRDGTVDGVGLDAYDAANPTWMMYYERDLNLNGIVDYIGTYTRDESGNVLTFVRERSGPYRYDQTWDERGNQLTYEYDEGADGSIDTSYAYGWDALDELVHYEADDDGDGALDYILDYVRDAEGKRLSALEDADGDGSADTEWIYTHDDVGREVLIEYDDGLDGTVDSVITYTFTDPALMIGTSTLDDGADGVVEEAYGFEYDAEERVLYYAIDLEADGVWEQEEWTTRDAEGRVLTSNYYTFLYSDPYESWREFTYDAIGRRLSSTGYFGIIDGAAVTDYLYTYTYGGSCP